MAPVLQLPLTHSYPVPLPTTSAGVCDHNLDPVFSLTLAFGLSIFGVQTPDLGLLNTHGAHKGNFLYSSSPRESNSILAN